MNAKDELVKTPYAFANTVTGNGDDSKSDKCGRKSSGQTFAMCVKLPTGFVGLPYSFFAGLPWMNLEATRIEIPFQGHVRLGEKWYDGHDGEHLLIIHGKRLISVFDQICWAMRAFTHPGGTETPVTSNEQQEAYVDRVEAKPMAEMF